MGGYLRRLCPIPTLWKDTELQRNFLHAASSDNKVQKSGSTRSAEILERTGRLSTEIVRDSRTEVSRLKVILSLPCGNLEEILKNYPRLYNQLNPCSRALQSVKTLRTRRTRTCGPGAPNPGRGPGAGAGAGVFKFLPNTSNRMPLGIEILPK